MLTPITKIDFAATFSNMTKGDVVKFSFDNVEELSIRRAASAFSKNNNVTLKVEKRRKERIFLVEQTA